MKYVYKFDTLEDLELQRDLDGEDIQPGDKVLVYSRLDTMSGHEIFRISKRFAGSGYPGNLDSSEMCFHGWRGSYNNVATYAHGVYAVKSVSREDGDFRGQYLRVELARKDLAKGQD